MDLGVIIFQHLHQYSSLFMMKHHYYFFKPERADQFNYRKHIITENTALDELSQK